HHCYFFQAEDGIRDFHVTGVQTCALPISARAASAAMMSPAPSSHSVAATQASLPLLAKTRSQTSVAMKKAIGKGMSIGWMGCPRSEERRVGKECRSPGPAYQ